MKEKEGERRSREEAEWGRGVLRKGQEKKRREEEQGRKKTE